MWHVWARARDRGLGRDRGRRAWAGKSCGCGFSGGSWSYQQGADGQDCRWPRV